MENERPSQPSYPAPTMEGYLAYRNAVDGGNYALENEATRAFIGHFFRDKPPIVHYQEAHALEVELRESGDAGDTARAAALTGRRIAELRQDGFEGGDDALLFKARRAALGDVLDAIRERLGFTVEHDERDY